MFKILYMKNKFKMMHYPGFNCVVNFYGTAFIMYKQVTFCRHSATRQVDALS